MVLLAEEAQVEAWFGPFGDSANLDARQLHCLHGMYHMLRNQFGHIRWNSQMGVSYVIMLWSIWRNCQSRCKIGARIAPNAPQAKKPFWTHPMVLLGEEAKVDAWFGLFGDGANIDARQVHNLHGTYHMLGNQFGRTRWNSQLTCVIWNLASACLETVLVSVQYRCTVCA